MATEALVCHKRRTGLLRSLLSWSWMTAYETIASVICLRKCCDPLSRLILCTLTNISKHLPQIKYVQRNASSGFQMVLMFSPQNKHTLTWPGDSKSCWRTKRNDTVGPEAPAEELPSRLLPAVCQAAAQREQVVLCRGTLHWPSAEDRSGRGAFPSYNEGECKGNANIGIFVIHLIHSISHRWYLQVSCFVLPKSKRQTDFI